MGNEKGYTLRSLQIYAKSKAGFNELGLSLNALVQYYDLFKVHKDDYLYGFLDELIPNVANTQAYMQTLYATAEQFLRIVPKVDSSAQSMLKTAYEMFKILRGISLCEESVRIDYKGIKTYDELKQKYRNAQHADARRLQVLDKLKVVPQDGMFNKVQIGVSGVRVEHISSRNCLDVLRETGLIRTSELAVALKYIEAAQKRGDYVGPFDAIVSRIGDITGEFWEQIPAVNTFVMYTNETEGIVHFMSNAVEDKKGSIDGAKLKCAKLGTAVVGNTTYTVIVVPIAVPYAILARGC